jgi:hypothetical protein
MDAYLSHNVASRRRAQRAAEAAAAGDAGIAPVAAAASALAGGSGVGAPTGGNTADGGRSAVGAGPCSNGESSIFDCFGVVVHHGTINAGHYTTYVRHCGRWYACDDAWILAVSDEEVARANAYLLFYLRRGVTDRVLDSVASLVR